MTVWFRVDASDEIGSGHVFRCLSIADNLRQDSIRAVFIGRVFKGNLIELIQQRGYEVLALPEKLNSIEVNNTESQLKHSHWLHASQWADAQATVEILGTQHVTAKDWILIDHFALDHWWEDYVTTHFPCRLAVIDGQADREHHVSILIDPTLCLPEDKWTGLLGQVEKFYSGFPYIPVHNAFFQKRDSVSIKQQLNTVFIAFGGVDSADYTGLSLEAAVGANVARILVVVGGAYPFMDKLRVLAEAHQQVELYQSISVDQMAELMSQSDLAIGAGGTMAWERCVMSLPSLVTVIADNQIQPIACLEEKQIAMRINASPLAYSIDLLDKLCFLRSHPIEIKKMSFSANQLSDAIVSFSWYNLFVSLVE